MPMHFTCYSLWQIVHIHMLLKQIKCQILSLSFFFSLLIGRQNFIQHVKKIQYHEHMHAQQDMDDASLAMNRSFLYFQSGELLSQQVCRDISLPLDMGKSITSKSFYTLRHTSHKILHKCGHFTHSFECIAYTQSITLKNYITNPYSQCKLDPHLQILQLFFKQ